MLTRNRISHTFRRTNTVITLAVVYSSSSIKNNSSGGDGGGLCVCVRVFVCS